MNSFISRLLRDAKAFALEHRDKWVLIGGFVFCFLVYALSQARDAVVHVYQTEKGPDFKDARVLGSQNDSIYEGNNGNVKSEEDQLQESV